MTTLEKALYELSQLKSRDPKSLSRDEITLIDYFTTLTNNYQEPAARSVALQNRIKNSCPFGTQEHLQETLNLLVAQPDELDPSGNRVAQLIEVGESLCFIPPEKATQVFARVEEMQIPTQGRALIIKGTEKWSSFDKSIANRNALKQRWNLT